MKVKQLLRFYAGLVAFTLIILNYSMQYVSFSSSKLDSLQATTDANVLKGSSRNNKSRKRVKKKTLWITTCESRRKSEDLDFLWKTASAFQVRNNNCSNHIGTLDVEESHHGNSDYHVQVKNVCQGVKWKSYATKLEATIRFASWLMEQLYIQAAPPILTYMANSSDSSDWFSRMDEIDQVVASSHDPAVLREEEHYVMFLDSDVFVNTWATGTTKDLLDTFHRISYNSTRIVMGGEPVCYPGTYCDASDFSAFYPHVTEGSSCPQFLNSGMYMGELRQVWKMLIDLTVMDKVQPAGFELLKKKTSDQGRATVWHANNPDKLVVDSAAQIFRNLFFGFINHTKPCQPTKQCFPCGPNANCSGTPYYFVDHYNNFRGGSSFDETRNEFTFHPVSTCETAPHPFIVHGNGVTKNAYRFFRAKVLQHHSFEEFDTKLENTANVSAVRAEKVPKVTTPTPTSEK